MKMNVMLPRLPNFLQIREIPEHHIDVAHLSDADIRLLGKEWTKALLAHAAKRRKQVKP